MGNDGGSISDEEWERFLRDAEAGSQNAPKEPSARARMVAGRLQGNTGEPTPWRRHEQPQRRPRTGWLVVALLALIAVTVAVLAPGRITGWLGGAGDAESPFATDSERPTLQRPFRGSPAERWADGTAGIQVPAAEATGWMTEAQVTEALDRSRDFLAGSSLDAAVLRGAHPKKAIALINPLQKDVRTYLKAAFRDPSRKNDPLLLFSRFPKADVRLVGDVVKTRGRITYREGEKGAVEVTTDVTYVYPLAHVSGSEVTRTIVRREIVMSWDDPKKIETEPGTFSLVSYKSDTTNGGCGDTYTGYYAPKFATDRPSAGTGPTVDPYDRSTPVRAGTRDGGDSGECGTASRS